MNKLDQFEALEKAASPSPWHRFHDENQPHPCHCGQIWSDHDLLFCPASGVDDEKEERVEDGRLIIAARNLAPAFIRLARAAKECSDRILAQNRSLTDAEIHAMAELRKALAPLLAEVQP